MDPRPLLVSSGKTSPTAVWSDPSPARGSFNEKLAQSTLSHRGGASRSSLQSSHSPPVSHRTSNSCPATSERNKVRPYWPRVFLPTIDVRSHENTFLQTGVAPRGQELRGSTPDKSGATSAKACCRHPTKQQSGVPVRSAQESDRTRCGNRARTNSSHWRPGSPRTHLGKARPPTVSSEPPGGAPCGS